MRLALGAVIRSMLAPLFVGPAIPTAPDAVRFLESIGFHLVGADGVEPPQLKNGRFTASWAHLCPARPNMSFSFTTFSAPASAYFPSASLTRYTGIALMT